jgi:hypothetical protein
MKRIIFRLALVFGFNLIYAQTSKEISTISLPENETKQCGNSGSKQGRQGCNLAFPCRINVDVYDAQTSQSICRNGYSNFLALVGKPLSQVKMKLMVLQLISL